MHTARLPLKTNLMRRVLCHPSIEYNGDEGQRMKETLKKNHNGVDVFGLYAAEQYNLYCIRLYLQLDWCIIWMCEA